MLQVKVFDAEDEMELEEDINEFLQTISEAQLMDIKFQVAGAGDADETWTGFSALILYRG